MAKIGVSINASLEGATNGLKELARALRDAVKALDGFTKSVNKSTETVGSFTTALNDAIRSLRNFGRSAERTGARGRARSAARDSAYESRSGRATALRAMRSGIVLSEGMKGGSGWKYGGVNPEWGKAFKEASGASKKMASGTSSFVKSATAGNSFFQKLSSLSPMLGRIGSVAGKFGALGIAIVGAIGTIKALNFALGRVLETARVYQENYATALRVGTNMGDTIALQRMWMGAGGSKSSMNIAMQSMMRQIGRNNPVFEKLGLNSRNLQQMDSGQALLKVLQALREVKNSALRESYLTSIFGRGSQNFPSILLAHPEFAEKALGSVSAPYRKYMEEATGTWAKIANASNNFGGKTQEFGVGFFSAWDTLFADIAEGIMGADWFSRGQQLGESLKEFGELIASVCKVLLTLGRVVGDVVLGVFKTLGTILSPVIEGFSVLADWLSWGVDKIFAFGSALDDWAKKQDEKNKQFFESLGIDNNSEILKPFWERGSSPSWDDLRPKKRGEREPERKLKNIADDGVSFPALEALKGFATVSGGWGNVGGYMNAGQVQALNSMWQAQNPVVVKLEQQIRATERVETAVKEVGVYQNGAIVVE